jgi:hypothetical protein
MPERKVWTNCTLWFDRETDPISLHFASKRNTFLWHRHTLLSSCPDFYVGFTVRFRGSGCVWNIYISGTIAKTEWTDNKNGYNAGLGAAWFCGPAVLCGGGHPSTWRAGLSWVHHLIRALREGTVPHTIVSAFIIATGITSLLGSIGTRYVPIYRSFHGIQLTLTLIDSH